MSALDLLAPDRRALFIGGQWREARGREALPGQGPRGRLDAHRGGRRRPGRTRSTALDAAVGRAAGLGRAPPPRERGEILRRAFELLTERADDFAELMSLEMGKTVAEASGEVTYGAEFFRWYSEEAVRIHGRWMHGPGRRQPAADRSRKPVGPCLFLTPWNFPLAMGTRKIGPAIAAGCTMVVKPAELTPLTMLALAGLLQEAGLPDGVLNVVTTHHSAGALRRR